MCESMRAGMQSCVCVFVLVCCPILDVAIIATKCPVPWTNSALSLQDSRRVRNVDMCTCLGLPIYHKGMTLT